ncbi:unnamed protein product [Allacma fusca]|uniref:Uncharacterized protein n=1 Tax=Allacma fusca TaxID=39272 RepID=A0A8J2P2M4_9HEXA|nr:unnamed protein product [Allacma fusca]
MIDIYGRRMYWQSKDSLCHGLLVNGVSKFYPMLLEPLNRILSWSENSGLFFLHRKVARAKREKKGRENAKNRIADQKYYSGVQDTENIGTRQFAVVLVQTVLFGVLVSLTVLVFEIIAHQGFRCWLFFNDYELSNLKDLFYP